MTILDKLRVGFIESARRTRFEPTAGIAATNTQKAIEEVVSDAAGAYQPLDSDLTAIAALSTTTFGRSLLTLADASSALTAIGAQPSDSDLTAIAALTTTTFGRALLTLANTAALQDAVGLGTRTPWTPVVSFATPGDLVVVYTAQLGWYTVHRNQVFASMRLLTSTFTHSTASGNLRVTGLPVTAENVSGQHSYAGGQWSGITKAGFSDVAFRLQANSNVIDFVASGSGSVSANVTASDVPSGGNIILAATLVFPI